MTQPRSLSGFGFAHDGSVDSLTPVSCPRRHSTRRATRKWRTWWRSCFASAGPDSALQPDLLEPPGTASQDLHAAVGRQALLSSATLPAADKTRLDTLITLANAQAIDLFAKGRVNGVPRGWYYSGANTFQSDEAGVTETVAAILARATAAEPVLFTATARDTGRRLGIDRDRDGLLDYDETRDLAPALAGRAESLPS